MLQGVPEGTQEALLQQELSKSLPVVRVELFARRGEAHVELESAKALGEVVLQRKPIEYNGASLSVKTWDEAQAERPPPPAKNPETSRNPAIAGTASSAAPQSSLGFQPRIRKTGKALPKAYAVPKAVKVEGEEEKPKQNQGQADFRAFMERTNEARRAASAASGASAAGGAGGASTSAASGSGASTTAGGAGGEGTGGERTATSSPASKKRESEAADEAPSKKPKTA